jgi:hypothetical protein
LSLFLALAQEAQLEMKFLGYGKNHQEIFLSFKNIGKVTISDITLYVDGKALKTMKGQAFPGSTFEEVLFLEEGKHLIEARSPEGAYASLEVTALKSEIEPSKEKPEEKPTSYSNILWTVLFVLIIVVITWLIKRK